MPRTRHTKPADLPQRQETRCLRIPGICSSCFPFPFMPLYDQNPLLFLAHHGGRSFHRPLASSLPVAVLFCPPLAPHNHPWAALSNSSSVKISPFPHASALFGPLRFLNPPPPLFFRFRRTLVAISCKHRLNDSISVAIFVDRALQGKRSDEYRSVDKFCFTFLKET